MKNNYKKYLISSAILACFIVGYYAFNKNTEQGSKAGPATKVRSSYSPKAAPTAAKEREEFFFEAFKNPQSGRIPANVRAKELELFDQVKDIRLKATMAPKFYWTEAGPNDVGGRTRALAIDIRNSNTVLAGGVSGGIWKSTNKGHSWKLKNSPNQSFAVSSICQDPRNGHQDTWYYVGGEFDGGSTNEAGAWYYGNGLYKSTDNGNSWTQVFGENLDGDILNNFSWNFPTDYASKIMVHPKTGDVYIASNWYGLRKIYFDGTKYTWGMVLGRGGDHSYCDFDIDPDGNVLCVLSEDGYSSDSYERAPGVYYIEYETGTISQIHASNTTFPTSHQRSLICFAPSDYNIGYVYTHKGSNEVAFHKIDIALNQLIDRTSNLPQADDNDNGVLGKQGNYNMTLAVKPDDADFIIIGSTSLFRSRDGFTTVPELYDGWIGGYKASSSSTYSQYTNHHADCHISVFDPDNADAMWSGHDGGLSYAEDITEQTTQSKLMTWIVKNNGYNITQFYTLADLTIANDSRYMGGSQDNGSPCFKWNEASTTSSTDASSGDGAYCYIGKNYAYASSQNGNIMRVGYDAEGIPLNPYGSSGSYDWTSINPSDATGQIFINPFVIDQNDENIMYYAAGSKVWINKELEDIPTFENETMQGWSAPELLSITGRTVTAMAISKSPQNILYYAGNSSTSKPSLYRVENSASEESQMVVTDISIPDAASGSYPYYISINPADADEFIMIFANYKIPSAFYSNDGGETYTQIDGNLMSTDESPGPSFRGAAIQNWEGETIYYIATSIGTYRTTVLNGNNTIWEVVAPELLGNIICNRVKTSDEDGRVVVATHGRGIFVGKPGDRPLDANDNLESKISIVIAPNPNNGEFKIIADNLSEQPCKVSIYNINGQLVFTKEYQTINELNHYLFNLSDQASGIYVANIEIDNKQYTKKIRIE